MEQLQRDKLQADIIAALARAVLDYEGNRKTRIEAVIYPLVVGGGLVTVGMGLAKLLGI